MQLWFRAVAALMLAVPAVAVFAFALPGAADAVTIAPDDDPVANGLSVFKQSPARPAAQPRRGKAGETPAEVLAEEWVATGGGNGGGGSPKG
jgi:hypothetical protein